MSDFLTVWDLGDIQTILIGDSKKWFVIGTQLNIEQHLLTAIKRENGSDENNLEQMITLWLVEGQATWEDLISALNSAPVNSRETAISIEKQFLGGSQSSVTQTTDTNSKEVRDVQYYTTLSCCTKQMQLKPIQVPHLLLVHAVYGSLQLAMLAL